MNAAEREADKLMARYFWKSEAIKTAQRHLDFHLENKRERHAEHWRNVIKYLNQYTA